MKSGLPNTSKFDIPCSSVRYSFVRMEGLEPPHLAASDPKSDVSTNSTTPGFIRRSTHEGDLSAEAPAKADT